MLILEWTWSLGVELEYSCQNFSWGINFLFRVSVVVVEWSVKVFTWVKGSLVLYSRVVPPGVSSIVYLQLFLIFPFSRSLASFSMLPCFHGLLLLSVVWGLLSSVFPALLVIWGTFLPPFDWFRNGEPLISLFLVNPSLALFFFVLTFLVLTATQLITRSLLAFPLANTDHQCKVSPKINHRSGWRWRIVYEVEYKPPLKISRTGNTQFCRLPKLFYQGPLIDPIDFCWKTEKGGCLCLVVVFSLGSSPTIETENRAKRLKPNVNRPPFRSPNETNAKWQIKHARNCISLRYLIRNINEHH